LKKWSELVESMLGMKPGRFWGLTGGLAEFTGGILTALGFLNPIGPLASISAMVVATRKAHWGKPVFANEGGAELPLTNIGIALAVALEGPGRYSLDHVLGIRVPGRVRFLAAAGTVIGLVAALRPDLGRFSSRISFPALYGNYAVVIISPERGSPVPAKWRSYWRI
jgi:putative oxidoreductase